MKLMRGLLGTATPRDVSQLDGNGFREIRIHKSKTSTGVTGDRYFVIKRDSDTFSFCVATSPEMAFLEPRHQGHRM